MKTVTHWKKEHRFESTHDGNTIKVDGDKQHGHGPKALLLSGLAGCSGVDVVDILQKMRVEFEDLKMEVEATLSEEHPKVFTSILITFSLKTAKENEEKIRKAVELSLEKYCGVAAMLRQVAPINYKLVIG